MGAQRPSDDCNHFNRPPSMLPLPPPLWTLPVPPPLPFPSSQFIPPLNPCQQYPPSFPPGSNYPPPRPPSIPPGSNYSPPRPPSFPPGSNYSPPRPPSFPPRSNYSPPPPAAKYCFNVMINSLDANVLFEFKRMINDNTRGVMDNWNVATSCSQWTGVCCNQFGKVTSLDLQNSFLEGTITSHITDMQDLQYLDLSSNSLSGTMPFGLGTLRDIQYIDLSGNKLSGNILLTYDSVALSYLNLEDNYFSGSAQIFVGGIPFCPVKVPQQSGLFISKNCLNLTSLGENCAVRQRQAAACNFFCNSYQSFGACGGHGTCVLGRRNVSSRCICNELYSPGSTNTTCIFSTPSTGISEYVYVSSRQQKLSILFRHSSSFYAFNRDRNRAGSWTVRLSFNWREQFDVWPVRCQGSCGSCWAMAAVSAVEAAYAITTPLISPPSLSVQQVIDCQGVGNCSGGWPLDALEYISNNDLSLDSLYPYNPTVLKQSCLQNVAKFTRISHYEEISFLGWIGMLLAVQQQPIVVFLEASSHSFVNYVNNIFSNDSCYSNGVDHSVLLVGYSLDLGTPHWIIRNSWGSSWGENGHMRMAIQGGPGVCGINTLPGYYPVIKKDSDPCNRNNFGSAFLEERTSGHAGTVSPCGRFDCFPVGKSNFCNCTLPFVAAVNKDGSQNCVPKYPCKFFTTNPCRFGDCVDLAFGSYTCVCPVGFGLGEYAADRRATCVPANLITGRQNFSVPSSAILTCEVISQNYGLSISQLMAQNKGLACNRNIPAGTILNVTTNYGGCALPYATNANDTCASIASIFGQATLSGPGSSNPNLNCSRLVPGQQVCIISGKVAEEQLCTNWYSFSLPAENCSSIINSKFKGNAVEFFTLNPGIYCDRLLSPVQFSISFSKPLEKVCLKATTIGTVLANCKLPKKVGKVAVGEKCRDILKKRFGGKQANYAKLNRNTSCSDSKIYRNYAYCY